MTSAFGRFTPSETPLECLQVMQAITVSNNLVSVEKDPLLHIFCVFFSVFFLIVMSLFLFGSIV